MPDVHDSGYKILFANRTIFRQLIETFVPEPWVKEADFDKAEKIDKSFVTEDYQKTESDLIYKVPLRGKTVYIYMLLEFQSTVDRFMGLSVPGYLVDFYRDYLKERRRVKYLPPVFPIVLYNGDRRWTAPTRMEELIEGYDLLGRFGVSFEYFKIAENEFSRESLLKIRNIVSTLFLAEAHYDLAALTVELLALFDREADKQAVSLFLNWFRQLAVHGRIEAEDYEALSEVYHDREEVHSMLIKALEREKRQIFEEGREEGREEGLQEGRMEGQQTLIRSMRERGLSVGEIARLTGLAEQEIERLLGEE
jgi:predicted transposase/invertase (TIGR01784 family)